MCLSLAGDSWKGDCWNSRPIVFACETSIERTSKKSFYHVSRACETSIERGFGDYRSHSFSPSTTRITSPRFFSNTANMKMIVAPVTMPATYHNQVQPRFSDAYQIIVMIDNNRNTEPSSSIPLTRNMIPANTPANENDPRISGSHGEFATPLMKMSAVDDA